MLMESAPVDVTLASRENTAIKHVPRASMVTYVKRHAVVIVLETKTRVIMSVVLVTRAVTQAIKGLCVHRLSQQASSTCTLLS
ncbi:hypothetical protein RRG08_029907 [Elysia crispata]|uniref:Uncharacterized protein n=1 Tax=Elysia crispata TaxID=231223 RepID=A0AAE1A8R3_9GAST|nr:hypothetical protein RRG08_029907 [Elysia crispata]